MTETPTELSKARAILYATGVAHVTGGLAYGVAYAQGRSQASELRAAAEAERGKYEMRIAELEGDLSGARHQIDLLEGRRALSRATIALADRNFGSAESALRASGKTLMLSVRPDEKDLAALAKKVNEFKIQIAENTDPQRRELLALAERFDELVPKPKAP
jgi:hypothetical protein